MYKIGEFSKLCRVSVNTLRYYDSEGLLRPDYIDQYTGYRYYSTQSLQRYHFVSALKSAGFTLEEIKSVLDSGDSLEAVLASREQELRAQLSGISDKLKMLSAIRNSLRKEGKQMLGVTVKESGGYQAATVRRLLGSRAEIGVIHDEIIGYLKKHNLSCGNPVVINYEIEHQETNLDYEVGVIFTGRLPKDCPYAERTIGISSETAGVVCTKQGLDRAYAALLEYTESQGFQLAGAYYETYHDDGMMEIAVPVRKLSSKSKEPRNDCIELPFENDPQVIGHWELVDCLACRAQFNPAKVKHTGQQDIREIYFLPGGERYWIFSWTKGYVLSSFGYPRIAEANRYSVETMDGENYLFVEMKLTQYAFSNGLPEIWVFRQLDRKAYSKDDIRKKDDTGLPFVSDEAVTGKWSVCDIVTEIGDFDPDSPNPRFPKADLFWKTVSFVPGGNCKITYGDGTSYEQPDYTWTKDYVLAHISFVAERYEIKRVKAADYLFIEWKTGDYCFGGRKPPYYVFRRDE